MEISGQRILCHFAVMMAFLGNEIQSRVAILGADFDLNRDSIPVLPCGTHRVDPFARRQKCERTCPFETQYKNCVEIAAAGSQNVVFNIHWPPRYGILGKLSLVDSRPRAQERYRAEI